MASVQLVSKSACKCVKRVPVLYIFFFVRPFPAMKKVPWPKKNNLKLITPNGSETELRHLQIVFDEILVTNNDPEKPC